MDTMSPTVKYQVKNHSTALTFGRRWMDSFNLLQNEDDFVGEGWTSCILDLPGTMSRMKMTGSNIKEITRKIMPIKRFLPKPFTMLLVHWEYVNALDC